MEIIHLVLGKVNPERMNGVNKVVHELATRQKNAGQQVQVWGITHNPVHDYPERNFATSLFKACRNPFGMSAALKYALMQLESDTVVHLHGGFIPVFYSIAKLLRARKMAVVLTPHGSYNTIALQKGQLKKKLYVPLIEKQVLKNVNMVHSLGKSEVEGLHTLLPGKAASLIPYGFDLKQVQTNKRILVKKHGSDRKMIFSFCGRIDVHTKGLDALVTAFIKMHAVSEHVQLWMIGDSSQRQQLEMQLQAAGVSDRVVFFGAKFGEEKMNLLRQADVFVHPSRNEGLPTAVLEAAALGLPSVVTRATNVGEVIETYKAGWVIEKTESDALYMAMRLAFNKWEQGNLTTLSANAKQMVKEAFDWDLVLDNMRNMYQQCLH